MILHVPADGSKATIVSFPRDSWVSIPGHGKDKINAAYVDGFNDAGKQGVKDLLSKQSAGILLAAQTITNLTGLHIDHYVQINLLGFYDISEAIGGVDLCLNEAQNVSTEGDPSHPNGYSGINLKKGWNRNVKGKQALAFVRQRHGFPTVSATSTGSNGSSTSCRPSSTRRPRAARCCTCPSCGRCWAQ